MTFNDRENNLSLILHFDGVIFVMKCQDYSHWEIILFNYNENSDSMLITLRERHCLWQAFSNTQGSLLHNCLISQLF